MNVIRINLPTDQAYNLMKLNFTQLRSFRVFAGLKPITTLGLFVLIPKSVGPAFAVLFRFV